MDTDIRDEIDRSFGDGPPSGYDDLLARGRTALRRRRLAEAGGMLAVAVIVVGGAAVALGGGEPDAAVPPATSPSATPSATSPSSTPPDVATWQGDDPVRYYKGFLELRPEVVVHQHIENPYDFRPPRMSDALDLTYQGERLWVLAEYRDGGSGYSAQAPSNGWASFEDWVASQVGEAGPGEDGWPETVRLDAQGDVVAAAGAEIVQRTDDPQLGETFAPAGATVGAALVTPAGEQASYFVVWRVIDGELDGITTPPRDIVGATFEELLTYARAQYDSGEGLR